jgi:hypothetical protein
MSKLDPIVDARSLVAIQKHIEDSKAEERLAREELTPEEERAVIRRVVRGQYGPDEDERTIDAAVDRYFEHRFEFEPPDRRSLLVDLYVRRGRLALLSLIPAALMALVLGGMWIAEGQREAAELRAEAAQAAAELRTVSDGRERLRREIERVMGEGDKYLIPRDATEVRRTAALAQAKLDRFDRLFSRYAPSGRPEVNPRPEEIHEARAGAKEAGRVQAEVEGEIRRVSDEVAAERRAKEAEAQHLAAEAEAARRAKEAEARLDSILAEIRAAAPPAGVLAEAERIQGMGRGSLAAGHIDEGKARVAELEKILSDARDLARLGPEMERLQASIDAVALEDAAKARAADAAREGAAALGAGDAPRLRAALERLRDLDRALSLEYEIVVTGGVERTYTKNPSEKAMYLLVRAQDRSGSPVRTRVADEEAGTGRTEEVSEWGERVPRAVYERVGADKRHDGRIDDPANRVFGRKERGRLRETVLIEDGGRPIERLGQITSW